MPTQQFFSYIMARTSICNEMMMRFALTNTLTWIFIVLIHWNNSLMIDMSPHSDTLPRFRANQSLLFLLNAACLGEKQQIQMYQFYSLWFYPIGARTHDRLYTWGEHANHYTTGAIVKCWIVYRNHTYVKLMEQTTVNTSDLPHFFVGIRNLI